MIGLQALMMLGGGLWCLLMGAAISRPYGLLAICGGALLGLIVGVFAGALMGELDSELTLRAGVARESHRKFQFAAWLFVSAIYWLAIAGFFLWSMRFVVRG
jgi:hypothetical protein